MLYDILLPLTFLSTIFIISLAGLPCARGRNKNDEIKIDNTENKANDTTQNPNPDLEAGPPGGPPPPGSTAPVPVPVPAPSAPLEAPELTENNQRFNQASVNFGNFKDLRGSNTPIVNGRVSSAITPVGAPLVPIAPAGASPLQMEEDKRATPVTSEESGLEGEEPKKKKKKKRKNKKKKRSGEEVEKEVEFEGDRMESVGGMTTAEMKKVKKFGVSVLPPDAVNGVEKKKTRNGEKRKKKKKRKRSRAPQDASGNMVTNLEQERMESQL
eukprot:snap_masked-scaffold_45-processed-gene-1.46-mRNA-1 protein AED:0.10 eAED:1.00 QI:0/-1/0/1/-1/1/1/0/269